MPSDEYNLGFDHGEQDRNNNAPRRDIQGRSDDYQLGYEHGYTGVSILHADTVNEVCDACGIPVEDSIEFEVFATSGPICGLVERDGFTDNGLARYRGVAHGHIWIVTSVNGRVTSRVRFRVVPGSFYALYSNQGFACDS